MKLPVVLAALLMVTCAARANSTRVGDLKVSRSQFISLRNLSGSCWMISSPQLVGWTCERKGFRNQQDEIAFYEKHYVEL